MKRIVLASVVIVLFAASALAQPSTPGCDNGRLTDPRAFFSALVSMYSGSDWSRALTDTQTRFYAAGIGQQNDSGGNHRGRIFLPNAQCPSAAPDPNDPVSVRLGVRQQAACFDHAVDVVEDGARWVWVDRGGLPYQPTMCDGGTTPGPVPQPPDIVLRLDGLDSTVRQLRADLDVARATVGRLETATSTMAGDIELLKVRPIPMACDVGRIFGLIGVSCRLR